MLRSADAGAVSRVPDIRHEGHLRAQALGHHRRAVQPDLLLHGAHRNDAHLQRCAPLGEKPQRLGSDERADAVIERSRDDHAVAHQEAALHQHARVADAQLCLRGSLVGRADVDEELVDLADLVRILVLEVHRGCADEADHRRCHAGHARAELHAVADDRTRIDAADRPAVHEALRIDVVDHQADLVGMPHHCNGRRT